MAEFTKPPKLQNVWSSVGAKTPNPDDSKIATGWLEEIPPREFFNYIEYKQDQMLAHLNQRGIAEWDTVSEYTADKSYVQGSNGVIYKAKTTHAGVNPVLESGASTSAGGTNWKLAFYLAADVYTKVEADNAYMAKNANLGDLTNTTQARLNLSVYSGAQVASLFMAKSSNLTDVSSAVTAFNNIKQFATDSYGGVSAFATDAELLAGTVTDKSVAPSKLKLGVSATLSTNGHVRLPNWLSGLQICWGNYTSLEDTGTNVLFTRPFNLACTAVICGFSQANMRGDISLSVSSRTTSGFMSNYKSDGSTGSVACNYIAIGY